MKTIYKNIRREFKQSIGRFFSVSALLTLGVFVLIGLNVTGSNMRQTAQSVYETSNLADAKVTSTVPISAETQAYLNKLKEIQKIEYGHTIDILLGSNSRALRIESLPDTLSKITLTQGRKPHNTSEIVLSDGLKSTYKIGDKLNLKAPKPTQSLAIRNSELTIVGFATSPEYLKKDSIGMTRIGDGTLAGFAYVKQELFNTAQPDFARLSLENLNGKAYSDKYEKQSSDLVNALQKQLNRHNASRIETLNQEVDKQILTGNKKITEAKIRLSQAQQQLESSQKELNESRLALLEQQTVLDENMNKARQQQQTGLIANLNEKQGILDYQKQALAQRENLLNEQIKSLDNNKAQLLELEKKVQEAQESKKAINHISLLIQNRNDYNDGYNTYGEDTERIDALGKTFPILFFIIAILVSFTTMRRMVEEKRIEMGSLRAFGYSKLAVMREFLLYSGATALLGIFFGSLLGLIVLPRIVFRAYSANFTFTDLMLSLHPWFILLALLIALLSTVLASWLAAKKELKELPATLMVPKPPKDGSRIFLENITPIWQRMSFSHKVTARNLFRYKSRMFMTIIGISGAIALMITGFGIRQSLDSIVKQQFGKITKYDVIALYNPKDSGKNISDIASIVTDKNEVKRSTGVYFDSVYTKKKGEAVKQKVSLIVPNEIDMFSQYTALKDYRTKNPLKLDDSGAIVSEKLAKIEGVNVGDNLTIYDINGQSHQIKIAKITQMFAGHYIYMDKTYYKSEVGSTESNNAYLINLKDKSRKSVNHFSVEFNALNASLGTIQSEDVKSTITNILDNLNNMIIVIVVAASMLSMVVLYTLININVSERIRELSTLKVLGFYPKEVLMYIYREANILTGVGISFGLFVGYLFHSYIMRVLPPSTAMVAPGLSPLNLLISVLLTIIFSLIIMVIMNHKIQKVDMLEALKSVE
ncbi:MAG: FtsX-like permease family protein [Lactococcus plantarum]|nr:FtsX-like permease family protein [Lactococcus plantarum]